MCRRCVESCGTKLRQAELVELLEALSIPAMTTTSEGFEGHRTYWCVGHDEVQQGEYPANNLSPSVLSHCTALLLIVMGF